MIKLFLYLEKNISLHEQRLDKLKFLVLEEKKQNMYFFLRGVNSPLL